MRFISACIIIVLVFSLFVSTVFAHSTPEFSKVSDGQVNEAVTKTVPIRFLPSHPLYFLIRSKEFVNKIFQPSAVDRAEFNFILSGKRLKESYELMKRNDLENAAESLDEYSQNHTKMLGQINKAKAKNQDVVVLTSQIAEDLRHHEVFFSAIDRSRDSWQDDKDFDEKFQEAFETFSKTVTVLDTISPGVKNRFKSVSD